MMLIPVSLEYMCSYQVPLYIELTLTSLDYIDKYISYPLYLMNLCIVTFDKDYENILCYTVLY